MRSSPGISLPNFTHFTMRVPGFTGSDAVAGAGPQLSSAIEFLPRIHEASQYCILP
jgi:hypothetical protein